MLVRAGTASGLGTTTVTLGMLAARRWRGLVVQAFRGEASQEASRVLRRRDDARLLHRPAGHRRRPARLVGPVGLDGGLLRDCDGGNEQRGGEREDGWQPTHVAADVITRRRLIGALAMTVLAPRAAAGETFVDMRGATVSLPAPPRRIVSLVPSATELVFALGGEDRLVGVTDYCDWPPAAREKQSVGGMVNPNLEVIVALKPQVVLATDDGNRRETFDQLRRLGIPVFQVAANSVAEMLDVAWRLGELTGRRQVVAPMVARVRRRIDAVADAVTGRGRPRVLYVLWPDPLIVPGRGAIVTELIRLAGGDSVTADEPLDYLRFSVEAAIARDPEVIVLARHGTGSEPIARDRWDRLASLPAVKTGRIHSVDGNLLHRYGPRLVDGLEQLGRAIHPEAFR